MFKELLAAEFASLRTLSTAQLDQLEAHYEALTRWNSRLNLTRISDLKESVQFHYSESLFLGQFLPAGSLRIADVGSGGGFPGIPVAILRPDCEMTLIESHQRKAVFLREVSRDLPNTRVLSKRAEDVSEHFDWVISRAVTPTDVLGFNLGENVALLIGEQDASGLGGQSTPVPWGNRRVLFHVKR
jgi:16S rRNA (guanine(527)-N(7))-methyltransferase RsmG